MSSTMALFGSLSEQTNHKRKAIGKLNGIKVMSANLKVTHRKKWKCPILDSIEESGNNKWTMVAKSWQLLSGKTMWVHRTILCFFNPCNFHTKITTYQKIKWLPIFMSQKSCSFSACVFIFHITNAKANKNMAGWQGDDASSPPKFPKQNKTPSRRP